MNEISSTTLDIHILKFRESELFIIFKVQYTCFKNYFSFT
jgi:hypothetical protein